MADHDKLETAALKLLGLIKVVGIKTDWIDGPETDRVFAWHEFDELREALGLPDPCVRVVSRD